MSQRRAIIATTTGHDYSFLSVIAALLWKDRINFHPSLFLVGSYQEWKDHKCATVVLDAIFKHDLHHVFAPHMEGVNDATIAQCARQHAATYPFHEDDVLVPSDADLLPLNKDFYWQHDLSKHVAATFYSNAYLGEENSHLPSCHFSMTSKTWREVMGYGIEPIENALSRTFSEYDLAGKMKAHLANQADASKFWPVWFTDELTSSKKLIGSKYWPDQVMKIPRNGHPPKDRLDRSSWPFFIDPDKYVDCHSLRPGWSGPNWPRLAPFLKKVLPQHADWLETYREDFRRAMGVDA